NKKETIQIEEDKTTTSTFWDDSKEAEKILKEIKNLKIWTVRYEAVESTMNDVEALFEFYEDGDISDEDMELELAKAEKHIEELEFQKMLSNEEDQLSAILEINPGAGGTESNDWAGMLMRMYIMWGEAQNFTVKEVNYQPGEVAGVKSVTLEIS